jgi:hypothetical protein
MIVFLTPARLDRGAGADSSGSQRAQDDTRVAIYWGQS